MVYHIKIMTQINWLFRLFSLKKRNSFFGRNHNWSCLFISYLKYKIITLTAKHQYTFFRLIDVTGRPCPMRYFYDLVIYFCTFQTIQQLTVRSIPRSFFTRSKFLAVTIFEIGLKILFLSKCLRIFTHDGMNHRHFKGRNFFRSSLGLPYISREIIIYIKFVKNLFINTVNTANTLNDARWIIGYIVIEYGSRPVQVIALGYSICCHQNMKIILL